ncbi:hypothetical protein ACFLKZ_03035 [Bacillus paranthracis]|uniref:hypothetical protein n=1 Tax=Bacillus TaxID=1386 RepID=UPI000BED7BB3|nr:MULTISPECIES: hypothetical protein [Bacillus cereus group]PEF54619.1 hypothetical protein CON32_28950 [Bacillus cereus]MDA1746567.1 hypothetical protein [Bacillus cereus group sp. LD121LC]MDA1889533.1 hypothetical protein [Bacillus cereus group sp. BY11-1LC]MDA2590032.1 hypothetical protein [Bacillus cereus group sp. Bc065]MDK7417542.1 hypothetical protein [Bacillus paranthracis]
MIKIPQTNFKELEAKHLVGLKDIVEEQINLNITSTNDQHLKLFLSYLKQNLDIILCGKIANLQDIIYTIENNFFISERKLSSVLKKRQTGIRKKEEITSYLTNFALDNYLSNYLPSTAYSSVKEFIAEVKKLTSVRWKGYNDILKVIFNYDNFTQAIEGWSAYDLVSLAGVSVCPYCNRSFVTTLQKNGKKTRAVLDHYYAKSLYPYLALSLYNLIPSCYVCNSSFKGDIDFYRDEAIYPYEEEFLNLATFKTNFNEEAPYDYKFLLGLSKEFKIGFEINTQDTILKRKIEKSIEVFALEDMYNTHLDIVSDLIRSGIVNNNSRINEIYEQFPDIFSSLEEVMQSLYLNYMNEQDLGKRPFSKLTQDICKELGLV